MLNRKLIRDLLRMWLQVLAIALVMACGVATIIIAGSALRALEDTRDAFYDRYLFGTVFSSLVSAPLSLDRRIAEIDGVSGMELRIVKPVLLDVPGMTEPATGLTISIPDDGEPSVNRLYIRSGRLPDPNRAGEVAVNEQFADAHRMMAGSSFQAVINGAKRTLVVTGIVLSPEYVFTLGPGDLVPDQRRFGVIFMPRRQLAGLFDMIGAFNDLTMRTQRGADLDNVIAATDVLLAPYGGAGAHDRSEQLSYAFLDSELKQLGNMVTIVPPIFLFVAAFLVNMILSRLIALEREVIGLLKALGYSSAAVAWHYAKFVVVVALTGTAIGGAIGVVIAPMLAGLYSSFYYFPFLLVSPSPDLFLIASLVSSLSALAGAAKTLWSVLSLPAAVAMQPPAPARQGSILKGYLREQHFFSQLTTMALRGMARHPLRTLLTTLSTALSLALIVTALFTFDSIEAMIDIVYFRTERQDATLTFGTEQPPRVMQAVAKLPGVLRAEPARSVPVVLYNGHKNKRLAISAWTAGADLSQILDDRLSPTRPADTGLMLSEHVADLLGLRIGDLAEVELIDHGERIEQVPVSGVFRSYIGLGVYMSDEALGRLAEDGPRVSGARIAIDPMSIDALYTALKSTPAVASIGLMTTSRQRFREHVAQNVTTMTSVYSVLAIIITFGVIYNTARIQLSERARELASLRVLGFTRAEAFRVLFVELAAIALVAQPIGWALGFLFCWAVVRGFDTDLFRIPLVIQPTTFGSGSGLVLTVASFTAIMIRRRVARLDLVSVLKTRE